MNVSILLYFLSALATAVFIYSKWAYSYWKRKGLPYLEPTFFYGSIKQLVRREVYLGEQFAMLHKQIKSKGWRHAGLYEFFKPIYMPVDLELLKCILQKDFWYFPNHAGIYLNEKDNPITGHLFNLENEKWKNLRSKLTPNFSSGKLKLMFQTLVECSLGLEEVLHVYRETGEPVSIKDVASRFSMDIIGSCAFGIDCKSLKDPNSQFSYFGSKIFRLSYTKLIKRWIINLVPRPILVKIHFRMIERDVENFFMNIVKDTIDYREKNNVDRKDFMQLLLQLRNRGAVGDDENVINGDKTFLTTNEIAAQCFVFFIAGFETSATLMTFAMFELAKHQDIQNKLREEIHAVLKKHDGKFTYDAAMEMTYLDQVINETFRRHSPASGINRLVCKPYKIPGTDVVLDVGTKIIISIMGIHMDPEIYPEPEKFDPERFSAENKRTIPNFAFMPFGEGPRMCIGARFGMMEAKVGLVTMVKNFKFTLNGRTKTPLKYSVRAIITSPEGGIWLNVEKIK